MPYFDRSLQRRSLQRKVSFVLPLLVAVALCATSFGQDLQIGDALGLKKSGAAKEIPVEFDVRLSPADASPGGEVTLSITAKLPPKHHIYSTTPHSGAETKIVVAPSNGLEPIDDGFQADHLPKISSEEGLDGKPQKVEKYRDRVTWTCRYRLSAEADPKTASIKGEVAYQVCNDNTCRPSEFDFNVKLASAAEVEGVQAPLAAPDPVGADEAAGQRREAPPTGLSSFEHRVGRKNDKKLAATWTVTLQPRQARPGDIVTVSVEAKLESTWHVYAPDQGKTADGEGPLPTLIAVKGLDRLETIDKSFVPNHPPQEKASEGWEGLSERFYEGQVVWSQRFKVPVDAPLGALPVTVAVSYGMCNHQGCHTSEFAVKNNLIVADKADEQAAVFITPAGDRPQAPPAIAPATASARGIDESKGLLFFLFAAMTAGFAALLTPCVFPMIPITVSFFLKQSEKEHHRPMTMASVYCLGIMGTFTGLGLLMSVLFGATSLNQLANNGWLNVAIGGMLVFFAMNLLGMFEIRVPSALLTYTAGKEGRGGFIGVLFMALTFTLTSFTCTFAFAGGLLVAAAQGDRLWPILGLLAFSFAFALPFFFLALFPSFLQKLPKSGGWMNVIKVTMGMIEFGAAFKFFSVADVAWHPTAWIFDYEFVLATWMVVSIATGMYLMGLFRLPHDTPRDHISVFRLVSAMGFFGLAAYMAVGLLSPIKPDGKLWANIDALLPPKINGGSDATGPYLEHGGLRYALDFQKALDFAAKENRPLFLDFTGVNCVNCRKMEHGPMSQPEIKERLAKFVRVQIFTDRVPNIADQAEARRLGTRNRAFQAEWFGDASLPAYAVIPPDPEILRDPQKILAKLVGFDEEGQNFARFLDDGLARWTTLKTEAASSRLVGRR